MRPSLSDPETDRFRAGIRALVPAIVTFLLVWVVFAFLVGFVLGSVDAGSILSLYGDTLFRWLPVLVISAWLVRKLDPQPAAVYGLDIDRRWVGNLVVGVLIALASFALSWTVGYQRGTIAAESAFQPQVETPALFVFLVVGVLLSFLVQNVYEEFIYRSVMIRNLADGARSRGLSARLAIAGGTVVSLLFFGLYHLPRGLMVVIDSVFVGMAFAVPYLLTGSLALSIGIHFGRLASSFLVVGDGYGGSPLLEEVGVIRIQTEGFALFAALWIVFAVVFVLLWVRVTRGELRIAENSYKTP